MIVRVELSTMSDCTTIDRVTAMLVWGSGKVWLR